MRTALRRTAGVLKQSGLRFALCGGYAFWARGAPEPDHDVDFIVAEHDVEQAAADLAKAGLAVRRPAEDWLFKVDTDGVVVDVLHRAAGDIDALLDRAEQIEVLSVEMPVLTATDLMTTKLCSLSEHFCDFSGLLAAARAVREQIDWDAVREAVAGNDFAVAFLFLTDRLNISS